MPRMFIHHVCFFLKPGTPDAAKEQLIADCRKYLAAVPGVKHLWAGANAMTPREVVDQTYQIGLLVAMEDHAAHDVYQTHPLHDEFISRNKAHWDHVRIHDFLG